MEAKEVRSSGRQTIERYGPGGFRISGVTYTGAVLVLAEKTVPWAVERFASLTPDDLRPIAEHGGIDILLLGTGSRMQFCPKPVRDALRQVGIVADAMDTGAACRTYSVLVAEERRVAAALFPIGS